MSVAAEPDKTPEQITDERMSAVFDELVPSEPDAAESGADDTPTTETDTAGQTETQEPGQSTEAKPASETKVEVTPEQLADSKYWGSLDHEGWERMERDYPVETKSIKTAQATINRMMSEARAEVDRIKNEGAPTQPTEPRTEQHDDEPSEELIAAIERARSLDPIEAAKGEIEKQRLLAGLVAKEIGFDSSAAREAKVYQGALAKAAKEVPELASFVGNKDDRLALDKIIDQSPSLSRLSQLGGEENYMTVMIEAGRTLKAQRASEKAAADAAATQAAADAKKKERQGIVQSNARTAAGEITQPHGTTTAAKTIDQRLSDRYDREVAGRG